MRCRRAARATSMARDAFSFLHLPLVAGIVLLALGVKKTLEHVDDPLKLVAAVGLCGGVALYLARRRRVPPPLPGRDRAPAARRGGGVPAAAAARDASSPALAALAVVAAICAALVAYESLRAQRMSAQRLSPPTRRPSDHGSAGP